MRYCAIDLPITSDSTYPQYGRSGTSTPKLGFLIQHWRISRRIDERRKCDCYGEGTAVVSRRPEKNSSGDGMEREMHILMWDVSAASTGLLATAFTRVLLAAQKTR